MPDLFTEVVEQVLSLYDGTLGDGDVTVESLWPYPRHTRAEIRAGEPAPAWTVRLMGEIMKHGDPALTVIPETVEAVPDVSPGKVATVEGNGQAILTGWQIARPLMAMATSIQRRIESLVEELKPLRIGVTHNLDLPVGYDRLMRYAVEKGGGVSFPTRLDEIVFLSADHIGWTGSAKEALRRTIQEIGQSRELIKVVVEVTGPEQLVRLESARVDVIYCRDFTVEDLGRLKDLTRAWTKVAVDETVSLAEIKALGPAGIGMYMVNVNTVPSTPGLFSIHFSL